MMISKLNNSALMKYLFRSNLNLFYRYYLLIIVFLTIIFCSSCKNKTESINPTEEKITESVYASGIVKSENQYQVYSTVSGLINTIFVTEGELVKKDQPILSVTNQSSKLIAENAKLALQNAGVNANQDKLNELKANIDFAGIKMKNDSNLLERQRNLWKVNVGSKDQLEQRELAYKNSTATYLSAKARYNDLQRQIKFAEEQSRNNLKISNSLEGDYTIKSESDGKVYNILKEKGELVTPQSPVALIGDATNFKLELQVDEYDISKIKIGQRVLLSLDSYKGQTFEAKVVKIYPAMNERSRSFKVDANFISSPPTLFPNLTAEANIIIETKEKALIIPRNYLINDSFIINANNEKKKVVTGLKNYEKVEIISGLKKDDKILKPQ